MVNETVEKAFVDITGNEPIYLRKAFGPKRLLIMSGLPFSGKSHLSTQISGNLNNKVVLVRSDSIRPVIASIMGRNEPLYDNEEHVNTFALGGMLLEYGLGRGLPAIADATNLKDEYRKWALGAAEKAGAEHLVVFLRLDVNTAVGRALKGSKYDSAADGGVYNMLKRENEPIEKCTTPYLVLEAGKDMKKPAKMLTKWLAGEINDVPGRVIPDRSMV